MTRVTVVGVGYVGLVTGAGLAHLGHDVCCVDTDAKKIEQLNAGGIPIHEEGLEELVRRGTESGGLRFSHGHSENSLSSQIYYLCVPTPQSVDGSADLSYLEAAARELAPHIRSDAIIVNKSTVPVGSTTLVERTIARPDVHVVSNPEFLREGSAVNDFMSPDRIVIGSDNQSAAVRIAALYLSLGANILVTDPASAELIKYASNGFLATKLTFINAIAAICEGVGADIQDVRLGMGYDKRIGADFLSPGPGWGGSCFPKDTRALIRISEDAGYDFQLLEKAVESNEDQFDRVVAKVAKAAGGELNGKRIGILGLAFKAGTDDTRMSPAIAVIERLAALGANVRAYDPVAAFEHPNVELCSDPYSACDGVDVAAVMTEWSEFKWLDPSKLAEAMSGKTIVDTRGVLDRGAIRRTGLSVVSIGRP